MIALWLQNVSHLLLHQLEVTDGPLMPVAGIPNGAVDTEIGAAKGYKAGIIFNHNPGGNVAPPWLADLTATVAEIAATVAATAATVAENTAALQRVSDHDVIDVMLIIELNDDLL